MLDSGWFLDPSYQWGHSSSPVIYKSSVIVQADQARGSFIAAFNLADAAKHGYVPDSTVCASDVPAGRPYPYTQPASSQIAPPGTASPVS